MTAGIAANENFPAGHPRHVPEAWPLLLSRDQLCAYIGVSAETLVKVCPVAPVDLGANVVRYNRDHVDAWVAGLPPRLISLRKSEEGGQDARPADEVPDPGEERTLSAVERVRARATGGARCRKTA